MGDPPIYIVRLYVTGHTAHAADAIRNVDILYREYLPKGSEVSVIDLSKDPQRAEDEKILATPMLVREHPLPRRRIIGDLSDVNKVLSELHLSAHVNGIPESGND
jgi:circadian clock protein KaiB